MNLTDILKFKLLANLDQRQKVSLFKINKFKAVYKYLKI